MTENNSAPNDHPASYLQRLMPCRIRQVLLVASLYDFFMIEEDGRLADILGESYKGRDLGYVPEISRVSSGQAALQALSTKHYDLVVTVMRVGDMDPFTFGREVKARQADLPVVILACESPELQRMLDHPDRQAIDRIFLWQGDGKILAGVIQAVEDMRNADSDVSLAGIPILLLVEDSVRFYSAYLPLLFEELWDLTQRLLQEDLSYTERALRQRGRPKILLATSFEEALELYHRFQGHLLGVVSDVRFPRGGILDPVAGLALAREIRKADPFLPLLIQSSEPPDVEEAERLRLRFIFKNSRTLIQDFRANLLEFGFGDLVFPAAPGREPVRIGVPGALEFQLDRIPVPVLMECVQTGALRRWLLARTEFRLADRIKALENIAGGPEAAGIREKIKEAMAEGRDNRHRGSIVPFSRNFQRDKLQFMRLAGGSIGGKARGLAFFDRVMSANRLQNKYPGVTIGIPRTLILGTDLFDAFIRNNRLLDQALAETSGRRIAGHFLQADLPPTMVGDLREYIRQVRGPLAVRSSSLLEDALYQPFAGIYATKMIPNQHMDEASRFRDLTNAIKLVFASVFSATAKAYIESTGHRVEEEKMAVIIQEVVGTPYGDHFYPHFSGVACSYNYYPAGHGKPQDGVANLALGLGKTIVDGGQALRFCPACPRVLPQFNTVEDYFDHSQREFYAVNLRESYTKAYEDEDEFMVKVPLTTAETDGTLTWLASTYSRENDRIFDGIQYPGPKLVTFAHILKNEVLPLPEILQDLLRLAEDAMACPVEIEFAAVLGKEQACPARFGFLQVRPMVVADQLVTVELEETAPGLTLCRSKRVLGNGVMDGLYDLVVVKRDSFDRSKSPLIAGQIGRINERLRGEGRPYILIGPGRWGSSDHWLGIPVAWGQINGVKVMVEVAMPDISVDPSQGSHFFQNVTSLRIGYFTVAEDSAEEGLDWDWLEQLPAESETGHVRLVRLEHPLQVRIDGRTGRGVILKPVKNQEQL